MTRSLLIRPLPFVLGSMFVAGSFAGQGVPRLDSYNGVAVRILQSNNTGNIHHINTRSPELSYLLLKPLEPKAGGLAHTGGTYWTSRNDTSTKPFWHGSRLCPPVCDAGRLATTLS